MCEPCPVGCVNCQYPGFEGKPVLSKGWASVEGFDWFSQDDNAIEASSRYLFLCPIGLDEACLAEPLPHRVLNASVTPSNTSNMTCKQGYEGSLCARCSPESHTRSGRKCKLCEAVTQEAAVTSTVVLVVGLLLSVLVYRYLTHHASSQLVRTLKRLIPDLLSDVKVSDEFSRLAPRALPFPLRLCSMSSD